MVAGRDEHPRGVRFRSGNDAVLTSNATQPGKVLLLILLMATADLLTIANEQIEALHMHGRALQVLTERKASKSKTVHCERAWPIFR
jgi:hypothetical protein